MVPRLKISEHLIVEGVLDSRGSPLLLRFLEPCLEFLEGVKLLWSLWLRFHLFNLFESTRLWGLSYGLVELCERVVDAFYAELLFSWAFAEYILDELLGYIRRVVLNWQEVIIFNQDSPILRSPRDTRPMDPDLRHPSLL